MTGDDQARQYEVPSSRLWRKIKENPSVAIGIGLTMGALGWGAYTYKGARAAGKPKSVFFMELRVKSQSMVVGAMTLGVAYALFRDYVLHPKTSEELDEIYRHPYGTDPKKFQPKDK